jgi:hypothetical protein
MAFPSSESAEEFAAVLIGFDVEGFSRTVEKAALRFGRQAGELAAQQILAGERIATDLARQAGFRFADALGDGAVYLRAQGPLTGKDLRGLQRLREELKYAHLKQTGLSIRAAWAQGSVRLIKPTAPLLEHNEVLWGAAVAQLHASLSTRQRTRRPARDPGPARPDLADREGEIAEMTFVFLRLCRSSEWERLDEPKLNAALGLISRWAEHLGGRLERITQDEKGAHARVGLPGVNADARDWPEILAEAQQALRGLGLDGAVAAAGGPVYRGPSEHGSTIVHGGAVNRAAKLCAGQPPGGLAVDASLAEPLRRSAPAAEAVVGRGPERATALAWLAGDGPRMVIVSGEPGIGKSHLLREVLARGETANRAFAAGAPTRMLDPMGAWFDLLGQALAHRWPGRCDRPWAEAAFSAAGLDSADLPLCARALRGVDGADAEAAGLSGGERAQRTHEGMTALVRALAEDGPLLIGIDDVHEIDDSSLLLTRGLLEEGLPIRIVTTLRPGHDRERLDPLRGHLSTLEIPLSPLTMPEVGALVASLAVEGIDLAEVMAISGGNPFQAVQAALAMVDRAGDNGQRTLSALLDRRLDRLDNDDREVLRALAITDRAWRAEDLDAIVPPFARRRGVEETLAGLARARLIAPTASSPQAFHASHRLLTEVIRRRMPAGVRRELARRAARRFSVRDASNANTPKAEIARLWAEAGSRGRAAVLYERAARAAAQEGADSACFQLLELALGLFEDEPEARLPRRSIRWLAELARALWSQGQVETANLAARRAIARAHRQSLPPRLSENALAACALRAETGQFLGDPREILLGSLESGRISASSREHIAAQGRGVCTAGYLLGLARLAGPSDALLGRGERLADDLDPRPAAYSLTARAFLHIIFARWSQGEATLRAARNICANSTDHQLMEWIETTCGIAAHLQGDGERAFGHFDVLAMLAKGRGSAMHAGWADYASAQTLLAVDRPHEAWERLNSAETWLAGVSDRQSHHICLGLRARLAWRLGEVDEALAAAARCGEMSARLLPTNHTSTEAFAAPAFVGALALTSSLSEAQRRAARGLVTTHLGELTRYAWVFPIARPRLATTRALIAALKRPGTAIRGLAAAAELADRMNMGFEAALARQLAADLSKETSPRMGDLS